MISNDVVLTVSDIFHIVRSLVDILIGSRESFSQPCHHAQSQDTSVTGLTEGIETFFSNISKAPHLSSHLQNSPLTCVKAEPPKPKLRISSSLLGLKSHRYRTDRRETNHQLDGYFGTSGVTKEDGRRWRRYHWSGNGYCMDLVGCVAEYLAATGGDC